MIDRDDGHHEWNRLIAYVERNASHLTWPQIITNDEIEFSMFIELQVPVYILIIYEKKENFTRNTIIIIT